MSNCAPSRPGHVDFIVYWQHWGTKSKKYVFFFLSLKLRSVNFKASTAYDFHHWRGSSKNPLQSFLKTNCLLNTARWSVIPVTSISITGRQHPEHNSFFRNIPVLWQISPSTPSRELRSAHFNHVSYSSARHSRLTANIKHCSASRCLEVFTSRTTAESLASSHPVSTGSVWELCEDRSVNNLAVWAEIPEETMQITTQAAIMYFFWATWFAKAYIKLDAILSLHLL